jgi:plastocyanin
MQVSMWVATQALPRSAAHPFYARLNQIERSWMTVSLVILAGHFGVPFFSLMGRAVKRRGWIWLHPEGLRPSLLDVAALVAVGGCFVAAMSWLMRRQALVPRRDPRLAESLAFENVRAIERGARRSGEHTQAREGGRVLHAWRVHCIGVARNRNSCADAGRSLMKRALVLGLLVGYAAGCGGSQPADTAQQTAETGTEPAAPTVQEGAQSAPAFDSSSITGTVTFDGEAPALRPLDMTAEAVCHEKHGGKPAPNEALVLGTGNTMGNIMVWVSKGLPAGQTWPAPETPVVLDQDGCVYKPHVMGIMVGQTYRILNSDGILHNIHTLPQINPAFNRGQPATVKEMTTTFPKPENMFQVKCDVHPWMSAYIGVFTHPFFSVTSTDGKFTISGLDAGSYEITAWHERLGTQTASITVATNETKNQNFTFALPATR